MDYLRSYLLRLVACSFLVTLSASLVTQPRLHRLVKLCGGCLLAIIALQPLVHLDFSRLPDLLYPYGLSQQNAVDEAKRKNEELLENLIRSQTEEAIQKELEALGIDGRFQLTLRMDRSVGAPVPWAVTLYADCTESQRAALSDYLMETLDIPKERQVWNDP